MPAIHSGTIGVLVDRSHTVPPIAESGFCRRLMRHSKQFGLTVFAFTSSNIHPEDYSITGYVFRNGAWVTSAFPLPDVVYNRICSKRGGSADIKRMLEHIAQQTSRKLIYWSRGLPGKWDICRSLSRVEGLIKHIPPTIPYRDSSQLEDWLQRHERIFLKPQAGMQGKGTLYVRQLDAENGLLIRGRDHSNHSFRRLFPKLQDGLSWVDKFIRKRSYILQPFLELNSQTGRPFDVRALMQKDGSGSWRLTGLAVREGPKDSMTSNLHGGGSPHPADIYLTQAFGSEQATILLKQMTTLSMSVSRHLEEQYGRLGELGIDFGIDREGKIWLLEVNSKPGRSAFLHINQPESAIQSVSRPIDYARYLIEQRRNGVSLEHLVIPTTSQPS